MGGVPGGQQLQVLSVEPDFVEVYVIREGEGFIDFVKGKETHLLVKPLRVLKEDSYRRQINNFIIRF